MKAEAHPTRQPNAAGVPSRKPRDNVYGTVQALRFLAAFAVVCLHSSFYAQERLHSTLGIYKSGANGVQLFFVISGFVMIVSSEKLLGMSTGASTFALRRILRIVPLYWAVNLVKLAILLAAPAVVLHARIDWSFIVKSLLFIPAINIDGAIEPLLGVGWTLNFEMFFYALFTLALVLKIEPLRFIGPILVALAAASLFRSAQWPVPLRFWADPIVLDFLAGMLLARLARTLQVLTVGAGGAALALGLLYLFLPSSMVPKADPLTLGGALTVTLASALTIGGAIIVDKWMGARIPRWVLFFGAASYSLYLIHPLVAPAAPQILAHMGLHVPFLAIALSVLAALTAGACVYIWVEQPLAGLTTRALQVRGWLPTASRWPPLDVSPAEAASPYGTEHR